MNEMANALIQMAKEAGASGATYLNAENIVLDPQFREICRRGGLVGINFCKDHLGDQSPDGIYRHLEYALALGGEHTVALGGDLDGTALPPSFGGIAFYEVLCEYLAQKGYSEELLDSIFFQNAFNFFSAALQSAENKVK